MKNITTQNPVFSGNVGIGTTNPGADLHIQGSSPKISIVSNLDNESRINLLERLGGDGDLGGFIRYAGGAVNNTVELGTVLSGTETSHIYLPRNGTGNVGIGATNPGSKLEVLQELNTTDIGGSILTVANTRLNTGSGSATIGFVTDEVDGNTANKRAQISASYDGTNGGKLVLSTHNGTSLSQALTIKNNGNVGIGTTDPAYKLEVEANNSDYASRIFNSHATGSGLAVSITSTSSSELVLNCISNSISRFSVRADGVATTNGSPVTSDDRLKHNEQAIVGAIETLGKITPKKYIKTADMYEADHDFELDADGNPVDENGEPVEHNIEAGVIAQQVLEIPELAFAVSPEGVDEDGNITAPYALNYNSLFTYAIAAIQEQQQIIEHLKSRIETLEQ